MDPAAREGIVSSLDEIVDAFGIQRLFARMEDPATHGIEVDEESLQSTIVMGTQLPQQIGGGNTLLHGAAFFDLVDETKSLLSSGIDINAQNDHGDTALLVACQTGKGDIAQLLIEAGADASIINNHDETGLHWLGSFRDETKLDMANRLLVAGAGSHLRLAAYDRDGDQRWRAICPDVIEFDDGRIRGGPILRSILDRDEISTRIHLQLLLDSATRAARSQGWQTELFVKMEVVLQAPIQLASELHLWDILELLLDTLRQCIAELPAGESVASLRRVRETKKDLGMFHFINTKTTPFLRAALSCDFEILRLYYHGYRRRDAESQTLKILDDSGFVLEVVETRQGMVGTLNFAILSGNKAAVQYLLSHDEIGPTIDDADCARQTAVHEAIDAHQFEILELLASSGATLDLSLKRDPKHSLSPVGASYMHVLGSSRIVEWEYVELLIKHGVPAGVKDDRGIDALAMALLRACFPLARALIEHGASLTHEGPFGLTFIGHLFLPHQAQQFDDLVATARQV